MSAGLVIVTLVALIIVLAVTVALCCERIIQVTADYHHELARANRLSDALEDALPRGLLPIHDAVVIDMFRRELDLDETHETFGGAS